jgi:hypothetical protein
MTSCGLLNVYRHFRETNCLHLQGIRVYSTLKTETARFEEIYCLHLQGRKVPPALKMEAVNPFKTSVMIYDTMRQHSKTQ